MFFFAFTSFSHLLFTVSKLYNTYYLLRLLMMVCTVLIWFILTVLQESSNLDAIFIVCRKIKNKISKLVFSLTPPPFLVKSQLFFFFLTLPLVNIVVTSWIMCQFMYQPVPVIFFSVWSWVVTVVTQYSKYNLKNIQSLIISY